MKKCALIISGLAFVLFSVAQSPPSHQPWDKLLKKHVNAAGMVNYKGFIKDKAELDAYLKTLSNSAPQAAWSQNDQKAFWINVYNAFTVSLIVQKYPVKSIKDIAGNIYKINTPWDIQFIKIGGKTYDLNNVEHGILRKKYNDPRIHFALVCASISCPKLQRDAYTGASLNTQLDNAGKEFLNDKAKNNIAADKASLSKYFSWYKGDFKQNGSMTDFINKYSSTKMNANTRISYLDYNWGLNEQK